MNCRYYTSYPNCSCDSPGVSCVMMRSTANPAGLLSLEHPMFRQGQIERDEIHTLRAENERLAAACRDVLQQRDDARRQRDEARAKVSELAVKLNEARRQHDEV